MALMFSQSGEAQTLFRYSEGENKAKQKVSGKFFFNDNDNNNNNKVIYIALDTKVLEHFTIKEENKMVQLHYLRNKTSLKKIGFQE